MSDDLKDRIEELERSLFDCSSDLKIYLDLCDSLHSELEKTMDALSAFRDFENTTFEGAGARTNRMSAYRNVKRKLLAALDMLEHSNGR